jgi:hypothetical protein
VSQNRRKRVSRAGGSPLRRKVTSPEFSEGRVFIKQCLEQCGVTELPEVPSPLSSPQHRRHLREAARLELREWEAKWLRMGADPESMAEACEGARVRVRVQRMSGGSSTACWLRCSPATVASTICAKP